MGNTISDLPGGTTVANMMGIKVLQLEDAYEEMALNETEDQYLKSCTESDSNMIALHKIYMKPCKPPSNTETMSNVAIASVPAALTVDGTIKIGVFEEGLPHTRPPKTIWFPESLLRKGNERFTETFLHECIHLHQRAHEDLWDKFYREQWNCIRYVGSIPKEVEARRRLNPDTLRAPFYAWNSSGGLYIPVAVYKNPDDADLTEVRLIFVRPDGSWSSVMPPGWMDFFGTQNPSLCEHPNEMAAYILSDNANPFDSEAARRLRNMYKTFNRGHK